MTRSWRFTDIEFFVLWQDLKEGGFPDPFYFTARTPDQEEFDRQQSEARTALRRRLTPDFAEVMRTMARPDLQVIGRAMDGADYRITERLVRVLGVREADRGYVVRQLPGETFWHSGDFTVTECPAVELADRIVAALPAAEAGRLPDTVLPARTEHEEMDYTYVRSQVLDSFTDSNVERGNYLLNTPATRRGSVEIIQTRSVYGPRGRTEHELEWRDLVDDGRYVFDDQNPPVVVGADAKRLTNMINSRIAAVVRAIKDERGWDGANIDEPEVSLRRTI